MPNLPKRSRRYQSGVEIDPGKLRYFRDLRGLTGDQLAARTGIHPVVIRMYEAGMRRPRQRNFKLLYVALGCAPEDLLAKGFGKAHLTDHMRE